MISNAQIAECLVRKEPSGDIASWITVNGQHIPLGADGQPIGGNPRVFGGNPVAFVPTERMARAMAGYVAANAAEQREADKTEVEMAKALGIPRTGDNLPFDLYGKGYGIECKMILRGKNEKITMNKAAIERKLSAAKENHLKVFTVVVDKRGVAEGHRPAYYVKSGVGSFRLGSMERMGSLTELRARIRG